MFRGSERLRGTSFSLAKSLPTAAMGACFHFELMIRLLVGRDDPPARLRKRSSILARLKPHFAAAREWEYLDDCSELRNKLTHCELDAVRKIVLRRVPDFKPRDLVHEAKVEDGAPILPQRERMQRLENTIAVSQTFSRSNGFMGWMLQGSQDGTFELATVVLERGVDLLNAKRTDEE